MKILSAEQLRALDKYTIEHEPIASIDLMERAANRFFTAVKRRIDKQAKVYVICGMGNNGGDGLAVARMLKGEGYQQVKVCVVKHAEQGSADFAENEKRLNGHLPISHISTETEIPAIEKNAVCIDAIFGTGLSRPAEGIAAQVIKAINNSGCKVYSIDMPSGLYCDQLNGKDDPIIHSAITYTFHCPKLNFMLAQNGEFVQAFEVLDIGLSKEHEDKLDSPYEYVDEARVLGIFQPRKKFSHKGTYGHALICAGSYGKMGAAVLCVAAALRSGAGLISVQVPKCGCDIMQMRNPEAMVVPDDHQALIGKVLQHKNYKAIGIGPGIGTEGYTADLVEIIVKGRAAPLVIDADALNVLAIRPHLKSMLPENAVITPHPLEFKRLAGDWTNDLQKIQKQMEYAKHYRAIVVLKGANTSIATPKGKLYFNSTGNPGMAKGGSGDVLTGVLTSLIAQQHYDQLTAVLVGVYVHGLAGDLARLDLGENGIKANDIVDYLPYAFKHLEGQV